VASDFLVVASTLLEIKAANLIPDDDPELDDEVADLAPSEARDILFQRLLTYKQYKNAAASLQARYEMACRSHPRTFGAPAEFLNLYPDYLDGVELSDLARHYVNCYTRRDAFLLESEECNNGTFAVRKTKKNILLRNSLESMGFTVDTQDDARVCYGFTANLSNNTIVRIQRRDAVIKE
jgi:chromatin segregation and condensation protein Rec8/ScpA/Scc1 (kleisin family)